VCVYCVDVVVGRGVAHCVIGCMIVVAGSDATITRVGSDDAVIDAIAAAYHVATVVDIAVSNHTGSISGVCIHNVGMRCVADG